MRNLFARHDYHDEIWLTDVLAALHEFFRGVENKDTTEEETFFSRRLSKWWILNLILQLNDCLPQQLDADMFREIPSEKGDALYLLADSFFGHARWLKTYFTCSIHSLSINIVIKPVAKQDQAGHLLHCIHSSVGQISPTATARHFSKGPKTGVIMLLGVRQVDMLGPFLWQECHEGRKAKAENEKESTRPRKGPQGLRLSRLVVLSHKDPGHQGFDRSFPSEHWIAGNGLTAEMETFHQTGAWWKEQTVSCLIMCSSVMSDPNVWMLSKCKFRRKC